jgi:uncharacterized membrane protein
LAILNRLHIFVGALVVWVMLAGVMLPYAWPWKPQTVLGWALFLALSPALFVAGEAHT